MNSDDPTNFTTELTVRVTRAGVNVTTGSLEVRSIGGRVTLLFDATTMRWRGVPRTRVASRPRNSGAGPIARSA